MNRHFRSKTLPFVVLALAGITASCGRSTKDDDTKTLEPRRLYGFDSCDDMMAYVKATAMDMALADGFGIDEWGVSPESGGDQPQDDSAGDGDEGSGDGVPPDHSGTNVQEAGVDEPDMVKTDGSRILALARGNLYALDANGVSPVLRGQVALPQGWDHQLFLSGSRALVISRIDNWELDAPVVPPEWQGEHAWVDVTQLSEIDLSDMANPTIVRTVYAGGGYVSARMIGSVVRLVLRSNPVDLDIRSWWDFLDGAESEPGDPGDPPPDGVDPGEPDEEPEEPSDQTGEPGEVEPDGEDPDDGGPDDGDPDDGDTGDETGEQRIAPSHGRKVHRSTALAGGVLPMRPQTLEFARTVAADDDFEAQKAAAKEKARVHNEAVLSASTPRNWLPQYVTSSGTTDLLVACEESMRPGVASGLGVLSVVTIDLAAGVQPGPAAGVFSSGETVYASTDKLYVATHPWYTIDPQWDEGVPDEVEPNDAEPEDGDGPADDPPEDGEIEPDDGGETGGTGDDELEDRPSLRLGVAETYVSYVHAFDISAPDDIAYQASGSVSGFLLNQFSMSERDGDLRVASTGLEFDDPQGEQSYVTVLRPDGDELAEVGRLGDLGRGERIYAVRFLGDTGYVVTFRQVDPLYVVDLSEPSQPTLRGELKINGYSAYLHPVGEGLLLGVGQDATDEGQTLGTQLSLFDVNDPAQPVRLHQYHLAGANSDAEFDHHAFLYWSANNMAVLPVRRYGWDEETGTDDSFHGALVLNVDPIAGISLSGTIEHPEPEWGGGWGDEPDWDDGDGGGDENPDHLGALPVRSLVLHDGLHTLSSAGVETTSLATFDHVAWLSFGE